VCIGTNLLAVNVYFSHVPFCVTLTHTVHYIPLSLITSVINVW
jgi:hypothetical protein